VTALALELGISRKHLSNVLNGRVPLMEPLIDRLARAAGADVEALRIFRDRTGWWDVRYGHARDHDRPVRSDRADDGLEMLED
jgi:plasmid maintenance system antidote protein VapI